MDRDQFDRLSRIVALGGTRRGALRLLVAGAVAGAAGGAAAAGRKRRGRDRAQDRAHAEQAEFCTTLCVDCSGKAIKRGANLARCDFDDESFLDGLDLRSATLGGACFARAELRGARFNGATAGGACFADADLTGASFRGTTLGNAVFCGADLRGADFRGSTVKAAQLACATVGCDTILPNGKPAVTCDPGETCCGGNCVVCGPCQTCGDGQCVAVADNAFACDGSALTDNGPGLKCTANANTGICVGGACNCSSAGDYDDDTNTCACNGQPCAGNPPPTQCCEVGFVCVENGDVFGETNCVACG